MLPTEALERATTFDLYILDAHSRYVKYQEDVSQGKVPVTKKPRAMPTESEMIKMLERARNFVHPKDRNNDNTKKSI